MDIHCPLPKEDRMPVLCSGSQALLTLTGCQKKKSSEEKRLHNISFLKHKGFYFLENVI